MKKIIALLCAVVLITMTFAGCKDNVYYDKGGNSHEVYMKHGKPYQDEYGRLIEKGEGKNDIADEYAFEYPAVLKTGRNKIENAFIQMEIPDDWYYNENDTSIFRIHHDGCKDEAPCELTIETNSSKTAESIFAAKTDAERTLEYALSAENGVTDYEEYTTKLFGIDTKVFKSNHLGKYSFYYFVFDYSHSAVSFIFSISNKCFDGKFDPEKFIEENMTLKTLPTK